MSKDSALTKIELNPSDANVMVRFVGELNENLKFVEKTFNVKIFQNGNNLKIQGSQKDVNLSADALERLYEAAGQGIEITKETLHLYIQDSFQKDKTIETVIKTPKKTPKDTLIESHAGILKIDNFKKSKIVPPFSNINFIDLND